MSFGAALRLLRLQSGLGLRDLARRVGVSSTYLSRVESGADPAPTPARLVHIARELKVPPETLLEIAHRVAPLLTEYVERVPEAGRFFADVALRNLDASQLDELHGFVRARFSEPSSDVPATSRSVAELLNDDRVVLELRCTTLVDALQIAAGRLASSQSEQSSIAAALLAHDAQACCGIGKGIAVACIGLPGVSDAAALITLAGPLPSKTPDGEALRAIVVLVTNRASSCASRYIADLVCLTDRGLVERLGKAESPARAIGAFEERTLRRR